MSERPAKKRGSGQRVGKSGAAPTRAPEAKEASETVSSGLPPDLTAEEYASACDPNGDFGCTTLRPLDAEFASHSSGLPRVPTAIGQSKGSERRTKRYGWIPDLPDIRDHVYATPLALSLPRQFDLRQHYDPFPPIYDQGELGSCTANALAGAIQFERLRQRLPRAQQIPSRLFIYYNERILAGAIPEKNGDLLVDHGAQLRDGIKSIVHQGTCFEGNAPGQWRYDVANYAAKPHIDCYNTALKDRVVGYSRLNQTFDQMRGCLAGGCPFVFGFTAYESLDTPAVEDSGDIPLPAAQESAIGGHAVMAVGYDDSKQTFTIRNSWGNKWGDKGYGTMPYAYLCNQSLAADFWTIRLMSIPPVGSRAAANR